MKTQQIILLLVLFLCGVFYSLFILTPRSSTLQWHLLEILPIAIGAISYWFAGIYWYINQIDSDSIYKNLGIIATFIVVPAVGYVIGLHYIWS